MGVLPNSRCVRERIAVGWALLRLQEPSPSPAWCLRGLCAFGHQTGVWLHNGPTALNDTFNFTGETTEILGTWIREEISKSHVRTQTHYDRQNTVYNYNRI